MMNVKGQYRNFQTLSTIQNKHKCTKLAQERLHVITTLFGFSEKEIKFILTFDFFENL